MGGAGFLFGQGAREPDIVVAAQKDQGDAEESTRIAVVNLDEGVQGSVGRTKLCTEPVTVSPARIMSMLLWRRREVVLTRVHMAHTSSYRQHFHRVSRALTQRHSRLIWSMRVNRSYSGKAQYELLYNVVSYTKNLNDNITYMYLNNILTEFHTAQDGAVSVMQNDLRDKDAIDRIEPYDLVALVEAPELRREENTTETLDISEYTEANTELAQSIDDQYMLCVTEIQQEIETLEESGENPFRSADRTVRAGG